MRLPHRERKLCREGRWCWNCRSSERFSLSDWSYFPLAVAAGIFLVPLVIAVRIDSSRCDGVSESGVDVFDIDRALSPYSR